jgi:hypothetical protein
VRVTERRLNEHLAAFAAPVAPLVTEPPVAGAALGDLPRSLGELLLGVDGPGTAEADDVPGERPGRTKGAAAPRAGITVQELDIVASGQNVRRRYAVDVRHAKDSKGTRLWATVGAYLAGGAIEGAEDAPTGAPAPQVARWIAPNGTTTHEGEDEILASGEAGEGRWILEVDLPRETAVVVDVRSAPERKR